MMYLASNSHSDIDFVVHQCAEFTQCVKNTHEKAVLRIYKYLKETQKEGLILLPNKKLNVECYTDDSFSGMYGTEDPKDPICVNSSIIYMINCSRRPILWFSNPQTEIFISTINSEYSTLY